MWRQVDQPLSVASTCRCLPCHTNMPHECHVQRESKIRYVEFVMEHRGDTQAHMGRGDSQAARVDRRRAEGRKWWGSGVVARLACSLLPIATPHTA
jgi:hypothetical protein